MSVGISNSEVGSHSQHLLNADITTTSFPVNGEH